ncbi:MAG TPA: HAD family phosphatase [Candidatus Saccharimonadales bacterium]|nr:HAD family phosphatase [Candidatus Saccharimonadales bacterium]
MQYKVIFFDWGGVIANDPGDEFLGDLLTSIGATEQQKKEIFQTYMVRFMEGKITERDYWEALRQKYGLAIHDTISEEFKKWKGLVANQEVLALARQAQQKGVKVAILSNVIEPTYNVIKQAGYYDLFDDVIASCKEGCAKPQKEIYELALERLHVQAKESLFIDDKQLCLDPATELGMATLLAKDPAQLVADLQGIIANP